MSRVARLTLSFLLAAGLAGVAATSYVAAAADAHLTQLSRNLVMAAVVLSGVTLGHLFLRFVRWQFVLRRLDARLPAVPSLGAYIGSFAFLPVPFYVGQVIARRRLLPEALRPSHEVIVLAFVWERTLDALTLVLLATPALPFGVGLGVWILAGLLCLARFRAAALSSVLHTLARMAALVSPYPLEFDPRMIRRAVGTRVSAIGFGASVALWLPITAALFGLSGATADPLPLVASIGATAYSLAVAALSMIPLGAGITGFALLSELEGLGAPASQATQLVFVFRVATLWFTLGVAVVALGFVRREKRKADPIDHFDAVDERYDVWLPEHYRAHMVDRKTRLMLERIQALAPTPHGLDAGCGRGWYLDAMRRGGARMSGADLSIKQLQAARRQTAAASLVQASITDLPLARDSADFAYTINVLHHLPGRGAQRVALGELGRVVRPGGLVILHDMNPRNPLFLWYYSYLFPILKGIDEGIEHFIDPRRLAELTDLEVVDVEYFTFVPDTIPPALLRPFARIERWLEAGPAAPWAAHFVAVLRVPER